MVYNRTQKKRTYKRKTKAKKPMRYKVADAAFSAYKLARRIKDAVNIEYKEFEDNIAFDQLGPGNPGSPVQDSYEFRPLCLPSQGLTANERIGDSIKLQRLTARGSIGFNPAFTTGATASALVRVILMRGKADNGKLYVVADSTSNDPYPILDQEGVFGAKNDYNKYNTKFLFDRTYTLDAAKRNIITFKWNFPLNWHQNFQPGGVNIQESGLYLGVVTNTATNGSNSPIFYMNYSVTYTDD